MAWVSGASSASSPSASLAMRWARATVSSRPSMCTMAVDPPMTPGTSPVARLATSMTSLATSRLTWVAARPIRSGAVARLTRASPKFIRPV
nr:hypothetical protein [Mycolicibacterium insubricum]